MFAPLLRKRPPTFGSGGGLVLYRPIQLSRRLLFALWTRSQHVAKPHTGKCPVNLPHTEKMVRWLITSGGVGSSLPRCYQSLLCFSQMCNPNTHVLPFNCSGALHVSPNCSRCSFKREARHIFSSTNISSNPSC